ncbi:MAG: integrase catalytic domain-containing protein, partial [Bacteroidales bacterium]|nr:integrase catalytic domain-containing protein [Bacteroidales bacterium]
SLLHFGQTVNAIFNKALREGRIGFNPLRGLNNLERFHAPDKHREYLTPDELNRFLAVEASTETERQIQIAFGFSSMTGLRLGDVRQLRWGDIKPMGEGWAVSIVQQKTGSPVTVPLNELALSLLPRCPENSDGNVFHLPGKVTKYVRGIRNKADITGKELTFHCARHTAATLAISAGAELYSVSKVLGHRNLVSTQIYAKVNLEKKIETVNLTNGVFG